ncbi:MAG TPA: glycosyltransferase family 39 protein [Sedimentisphaerales bacterium]|nr:glycosyltransferase family 39 protein [Sedimentisphaerales bacterium]
MEVQQASRAVHTGWRAAVVIALVLAGTYLFMGTQSTLWDRDEPRFARAAVEMVESGNYLVPTFNGRMWADKPILFYWLMAGTIRFLGPTELACRFWGAVGSGLTCLLVFVMAKRLSGVRAGLWAMLILGSTLMMLVVGTVATIDAVLLPLIVGVLAVFMFLPESGVRAYQIIMMGAALGLGMLAKGPIGVLPIPVIAATLWLGRKVTPGTGRYVWQTGAALIVGVLIFLAWAIPANNATGGEFLRVFVGRHVLTRAIKPMEHHGGNFLLYLPYYLVVIVVGFFPWTLHLPGAFSAVAGGRVGGQYGRALLLGWIVPILVIMTLAVTKLPHYILFVWPALALAVAGTIVAAEQGRLTQRDRIWLRRGVWFFGPLAAVLGVGLIVGPWFVTITDLRWSGAAVGIVLTVMAIIAVRAQRANRPEASARVLLGGMVVFGIIVLFGIVPALERVKISPAIAKAVNDRTDRQTPVAGYKYGEPTLNFYVGRPIETLGSEDAVAAWAKEQRPGVLIIPRSKLDEIERRCGSLALERIGSKKGFNYSKGQPLEVVALVRRGKVL